MLFLVLRLLILEIIVLVPLYFSIINYDVFLFPKEKIFIFLSLNLLVVISALLIQKKKLKFPKLSIICFIIFFLSISGNLSKYSVVCAQNIITLCCLAIFFYSFINCDKKTFKKAEILLLSIGVFQFFLFLAQYYSLEHILPHSNYPDYLHLKNCYGTFGNKNFLASFMFLILPISIKIIIQKRSVITGYLLSFLIIITIFLTKTKASIISLFSIFLFLFMLKKYKTIIFNKRFSFYFIITLIIISFSLIIISPIGLKEHVTQYKNSISQRFAIWNVALEMLKDIKLTGLGISNYKLYHFQYQRNIVKKPQMKKYFCRADKVHNDYIQIIIETGLFSIIIFYFIINLLNYFFKKTKNDLEYSCNLAAIIAVLINSLFTFPFYLISNSVIILFHLSYLSFSNNKENFIFKTKPYLTQKVFPLMIIFFSIFVFIISVNIFESNYYFGLGEYQYISGKLLSAYKNYNKACSINKYNGIAYSRAAEMEVKKISEILINRVENDKNNIDTDDKVKKILNRVKLFLKISKITFAQPVVYRQIAKLYYFMYEFGEVSKEEVENKMLYAISLEPENRNLLSRLYDFYEKTGQLKKMKKLFK